MERKEFLNMVGMSVGAIVLQHCISGCSTKSDPAPVVPPPGGGGGGGSTGITGNAETGKTIDFVLDLTNSNFSNLKNNGNAAIAGSVIVARAKDGSFIAVSKACTHAQTTIDYRADKDDFLCSNHGSTFDLTGKVTKSPAATNLISFKTSFDSAKNTLSVKE
jgi:cytochrome b6-f complex iron-sulfur subunit